MSNGQWCSATLVQKTSLVLKQTEDLDYIGLPQGASEYASKFLDLTWHILRFVSCSLSKFDLPPESYANSVSADHNTATPNLKQMQLEHEDQERQEQNEQDRSKVSNRMFRDQGKDIVA